MPENDKPAESGVSKFYHDASSAVSKYVSDVKGVIGIFTQAGDEGKYIAEQKAPMIEKAAEADPARVEAKKSPRKPSGPG